MKRSQSENGFLKADPCCVVCGANYRFTLIGPRILRMEYDPEGIFEDRRTQIVQNRHMECPQFTVHETDETLEIMTKRYVLHYRKGKFSPYSLTVDARNNYTNYGNVWRYGQTTYGEPPRHHNLFGTVRTLDKLNGACPLDFGLMDRSGHSLIDDSASVVLEEDGTPVPRRQGVIDMYYISCGLEYAETIRDFYRLTGIPPMLPRYALGNWWCRYHAYTDREYRSLMNRFSKEEMPFSVVLLDMDWHITKMPDDCSRGWTGYTWNRELFPDPPAFLTELHKRGLHVALNLHPADGIQPNEECYPAVAKRMGMNPSSGLPVSFDCTDAHFMRTYLEEVLHPLEKQGVDFWWIDWQQGRWSAVPGLDPLWKINHDLYKDNCRDGRRGLILSRYAGLGSHCCPLGFSGDTYATWDSLEFQPYFTATAANVGFPWWSHDIGGFKSGLHEHELYLRWLQFGVFSPVLRLHCTNNPFCAREPWSYDEKTAKLAASLLQLRVRLIPYSYTMIWRLHCGMKAPLFPVYWVYPQQDEAYKVRNQYFFGSEMMVCPITKKTDPVTGMASVSAWIPEGIWTDFTSGKVYQGPKKERLSRPVEKMAVLAKPGAIVPLNGSGLDGTGNPSAMEVLVFPGASNRFDLFEDDGESDHFEQGDCAITKMAWQWEGTHARLTIHTEGNQALLPAARSYKIGLRGIAGAHAEGLKEFDEENRTLYVTLPSQPAEKEICVDFTDIELALGYQVKERLFRFLSEAEITVDLKSEIWKCIRSGNTSESLLVSLKAMHLQDELQDVLTEILTD